VKRRPAAPSGDVDIPRAPAQPAARLWPARHAWWRIREPFLLPLVLVALTRGFMWWRLPYAAEDAYITFRYSTNLAIGNGLVYNPDERVMGFSSPLWTVWSALGVRLVNAPVDWARAWSMLADLLTVVLAAGLLRRHAGHAAAWCFAVFFAAWPFFAAVSASGMETGVMLSLVVASAVLAERRSALAGARRTALGLAAGGALAVWLGYAALGVAYFFWYLTVPLGGFLLLAACGMPRIVRSEVGLVSPAVARRRSQGPGWYTDIVAERRPEWLVVRGALLTRAEGFAALTAPLRSPAERDSLLARYAVRGVFPPDGGDQAMVVLERVRQ
jgi:hypothetical protein